MIVMGLSNLNWAKAREAEKTIKTPMISVTLHFPINSSCAKGFKKI
jgi:hypothetical protein